MLAASQNNGAPGPPATHETTPSALRHRALEETQPGPPDALAAAAADIPQPALVQRENSAGDSHAAVSQPSSSFLTRTFRGADGSRAYKLFVPSQCRAGGGALIVMLHGCTQSADDFAAGTRMNVLAEEYGFLVAYPEQPSSANPAKCWNWFNRRDQQRDRGEPALIAGITREISDEYAVDRSRVYVAGMSAGGAAAAVLGATYPDVYAAIGVHSGLACGLAHDAASAFAAMRGAESTTRTEGSEPRAAQAPIPTITFQGDRDTTVNPRNSDRFTAGLLSADRIKQTITERTSAGGRDVTQTVYADESNRRVLEQWVIHGAKHAWSGGSADGSYTDPQGPDASREMVRFFLSQQHPEGHAAVIHAPGTSPKSSQA